MELRAIVSTLSRHKTAAALIVLEVALSCAIVTNAVHLIVQRVERLGQQSGLVDDELVRIQLSGITKPKDEQADTRRDLALLREIPGVEGVTLMNTMPFSNNNWNTGINLTPDQPRPTVSSALYAAREDALKTLGLKLVAGRDFVADDYRDFDESVPSPDIASVIVNRRTAERLFPDGSALGRTIYIFTTPSRIVGIVDELAKPSTRSGPEHFATLLPLRFSSHGGSFVLRARPAERDRVREAAVAALLKADPMRVVRKQENVDAIRGAFFRQDRAMVGLLAGVCLALLVVTAFGIVGLASFWVQQRTRMIGIRRALGARRLQILQYFQAENLLLAGAGIVIGLAGAVGINLMLMSLYELPRLPWAYLPLGAAVLVGLGQLAVLGPALRAAAQPPMSVMRMS